MMRTTKTCLGTATKKPAEHYDIELVISSWLGTGDTVASATAKCLSGSTDMSATMIGAVTHDGAGTVTIELLGAGEAGQTYTVEATAATTNGDVWTPWVYLKVE